jgi:ferrous iron transport protein A
VLINFIFCVGLTLFKPHEKPIAFLKHLSEIRNMSRIILNCSQMMNLTQLNFGKKAIITKVNGQLLALKLFEMGILPGETVALSNVAPFGDPIAINLSESKVCLRMQDAKCIEIKLVD